MRRCQPYHRPMSKMPIISVCGAAGVLLLAGCTQGIDNVSNAAEEVRSSAERMASRNRAANDAREAQILAEAVEIDRKTRDAEPNTSEQAGRYEVRREGNAWAVYDTNTGRLARTGARTQGLTQGQAEQAAYDLQAQENEDRMREAALSSRR